MVMQAPTQEKPNVQATERVEHAVPARQPESVSQIAQRLFAAYHVDNGGMNLAGCTLEDRPLVQVELRDANGTSVRFVDGYAQPSDPKLREQLGLAQTRAIDKPPSQAGMAFSQFLRHGLPELDRVAAAGGPTPERITIVWCKYAEGKLRLNVGGQTLDLPFAGWAKTLQPPAYVCPHSGLSTYHLLPLDDGRIVAAEAVARCEETGRRALESELVVCAATGKRVLAELARTCPVTGTRLLASQMVACNTCGELVAPAALKRGQCLACRTTHTVSKDDPRMARLLDEHPELDRWRNWRIAETATVYVLQASSWLRRLLVVADKQTLEVRRVAMAGRFQSNWTVAEPEQFEAPS